MIQRYRTKIIEVEAIQWDGKNSAEVEEFTEDGFNVGYDEDGLWAEVYDYLQNSFIPVNLKDFIIKGTKGEFYPCDAGVFKTKYEPVETEADNALGLYRAEVEK